MSLKTSSSRADFWERFKATTLLVISGAATLLLFNNCAVENQVDNQPERTVELNAEDRDILRALSKKERTALCSEEQIFCRRFVYSPDQAVGSDLKNYCFQSEAQGKEVCVNVFEFRYDSSKSVLKRTYEEAFCFNLDEKSRLEKEHRHYANNIDSAIEDTLQFCSQLD